MKMHLKVLSAKWRPFSPGRHELRSRWERHNFPDDFIQMTFLLTEYFHFDCNLNELCSLVLKWQKDSIAHRNGLTLSGHKAINKNNKKTKSTIPYGLIGQQSINPWCAKLFWKLISQVRIHCYLYNKINEYIMQIVESIVLMDDKCTYNPFVQHTNEYIMLILEWIRFFVIHRQTSNFSGTFKVLITQM